MANKEDTRIWQGSILSVRNALDTAWIDFTYVINYNAPGVPPNKILANTAANDNDAFRLDLIDYGIVTFNTFDNPDDLFQAEMYDMWQTREERKFKLVMPEGIRNHRILIGYVNDMPIQGRHRQFWTMDLSIKLNNDYGWVYPDPTLSAASPNTGAAAGGDTVTLTGTNFEDGLTSVTIGSIVVPEEDVTVVSNTELTFVTPPHAAGAVTITAETPSGVSGTESFTYT